MTHCRKEHIFILVIVLVTCPFSVLCQEKGDYYIFPKQDSISFSIQDFPSVSPYGTKTTYAGGLHWGILLQEQRSIYNRMKYKHLVIVPYMDCSRSWLIPNQGKDLIVDYFDTAFKILEYNCQDFQTTLNNNPIGDDLFRFRQIINNTMTEYAISCDFGADTQAVLHHKSDLNEKADYPIAEDYPTPSELAEEVKDNSWFGAGCHLGYVQEFWPHNWLFQSPIHEACFIMSLRRKKACLDFGCLFALKNHLSKDGSVVDTDLGYKWVTDKSIDYVTACLDFGYVVLDNDFFSVRPYFGMGGGMLHQDTGLVEGIDKESIISSLPCFRSQCGLKIDYKFWRQLTSIPNEVYNSRYFETKLSFKVSIARSFFKEIDPFWSINAGLVFDIVIWDI